LKAYIGVTDEPWFRFLAAEIDLDEVNFWRPKDTRVFRSLQPGDLFLFKLRQPRHAIVGGAFFVRFSLLPMSLAWAAFERRNGAATLREFRDRLGRLRSGSVAPGADYQIGCILLAEPFFLDEPDWIIGPRDWEKETVQGSNYDLKTGEGRRIWGELVARVPTKVVPAYEPVEPPAVQERYGAPLLVYPRLGQGSFRIEVTEHYSRRCAVTGERTLPALEAAHIKPYAEGGPHAVSNGLLLRSDLHHLFDAGYITVSPDHRLEVSRRIREEFENGRNYYALDGQPIRNPSAPALAPSSEFLGWHRQNAFRG
jgi:putative restriction endonuclease